MRKADRMAFCEPAKMAVVCGFHHPRLFFREGRGTETNQVHPMSVIARYPKRIARKIEVDPDKPVFSVAEVCILLGCSRWTVIRLFENEPGVLIMLRPETLHKRRRRMIRIPRAVFLRVKAKKFLA
jgi:hypothetical protein